MAFDKDKPAGGEDAGTLDNQVRINNAALEDALFAEHRFTTGGSQTGRHKFGRGTTAARNLITWEADAIWFNTDVYAGHTVIQMYNGTTWINIDVYQSTVFRTDAQTRSTVCQFADWILVPIVSNALAVDLALSPRKYAGLTQNVTLSNPINDPAAGTTGTAIEFDLIQAGSGGYTVTFGNNYRSVAGLRPVIASAVGALTKLFITSTIDGKYLVSSAPDFKAIV